jgi:hypothetical protein
MEFLGPGDSVKGLLPGCVSGSEPLTGKAPVYFLTRRMR